MAPAEKLAGLLAVALFTAAGWGWGEMLPAVRRLRPGVRHAYLYLLGLGWVAGGLYVASHLLGLPLRLPAVLALAALPLVAGGLRRVLGGAMQRPPSVRPESGSVTAGAGSFCGRSLKTRPSDSNSFGSVLERPRRPGAQLSRSRLIPALALLAASGVTLALLGEAVTLPLRDWDGRMTWSMQARYVHAAGTVDAPVLRGEKWFVTLTHYPLMMPVAQAAAMELDFVGRAGRPERAEVEDAAFRPLYAAFFPVFLALVWGGVRARSGATAAFYTVLAEVLLPFVAFYPGGGANSAYSDLPLACFYGAGLLLLLERRLDLSAGIAGGLLLAYGTMTKDEGGALAVAALLLAAATLAWRRAAIAAKGKAAEGGSRLQPYLPLLVTALLVAGALAFVASWRAGIPLRYTPDYRGFLSQRGLLRPLWERAPLLFSKVRYEMIAFDHWGIFWSVAPLVLLAGRRGLRRRTAPALALAVLAPLSIVVFVYAITDIPAELPRMTWNRFLLQGCVPLFILFGWALADLLRRARWLPRVLGGVGRRP